MLTNPDMLHAAILPHHTKWFQLFEQLRYVVVDEAHIYRGVFGSHVANVLRRLFRLCAHYGSRPQLILLLGHHRPPRRAGGVAHRPPASRSSTTPAPRPARAASSSLNPPVVDAALGVRGEHLRPGRADRRWPSCAPSRQTIVFARSRTGVELLLTHLREALREGRGPRERLRGYRGGYLPSERRAIEAGLRDASVLGVVSTNALELGLDIGRLDAAVLAGYPGSVAATWQQMGRAGRRQEPSVSVLVASSSPVDQYIASHPAYLLAGSPEEARLDPDNLHILLAHLRAAAFELPFEPGERFGEAPADDLLAFLAEEGHVRQADDGRWYWASENFPASEIPLRTAAAGERRHHRYRRADGRGSSARSTSSARRRSSTRTPSTSTSPASTTSTGWTGTSARRTSAPSTSTTTPRPTRRSRSSRWRRSPARRPRAAPASHGEVMVSRLATIYKKLQASRR